MAREDADRNLLFGVLALQMDFITREALIAAVSAWVLDKGQSLDSILVEQGALSVSRRAMLEPLVREHIRAHDSDPAMSLAAVSSAESIRRELATVPDGDVQASLAAASAARTRREPTDTGATVGDGSDAWSPRFRILRPHAKGGLGEVFVARDVELNRQVALKEIQIQHADRPDSRARFLLEAEITGALEHPGIVPVYGLGHYPDGRPFYAMRFVRGDNLADAIKRYHHPETPSRDLAARGVEFRKLLGRFVDVCNAVAYAHSKGVLHRDLKPDNVMLGKYGETLVVDWGLAKAIGQPDPTLPADEEAVTPSSGGTGLETLPGKALGTPRFMSPEQAAGDLDRLGPASDVYSLGATLYAVLTGRPAFEDRDVGVVLQKVLRGEFPLPRQVNREVPRALEAVCLKAMALRPEDRYATPRALADDVEKWLADAPVSAYREPWTTRARRWAARHHTAVMATAAAALVGLAAGGYLLYDARLRAAQRLTAARDRVDALATAETRALPLIVEQLGADRRLVRDRLARMARGDGPGDDRRRLPAALALLPDDPALADFLTARLLGPETTPDEVLVIREALVANRMAERAAAPARRALAGKADGLSDAHLRAAGALAGLAPADPALAAIAEPIARKLARENPLLIAAWREVFEPIAPALTAPLRRIYARRDEPEPRALAFTLLYEFATRPKNAGEADDLAALIGDADPDRFRRLLARLGTADRDRAIAALAPQVKEPARFDDERARRQGRMALALLELGRAEAVWPLFRHRDDPSVRTELIHNLARFGFDPARVVERLGGEAERDVSARRALILCLGEFRPEAIADPHRRALTARFLAWYRADPDPGIHGGLDWLLRRWGRGDELGRIDKELAGGTPPTGRGWYVNGQGQTYTIIRGPVEFRMGSTKASDPERNQNEVQHLRQIGRSFAIAAREVTLAEYSRFLDAKPDPAEDYRENPQFKQTTPTPDCAMGGVTWYKAADYCNWLSAQEGIPEDQWCYPAKIGPGMKLPPDHLGRTGYRLPTEAEWEYACRAGAASSRPYGGSEAWLADYGWYLANEGRKMQPTGQGKPNDLGLFDMLGNAFEWCSDPYRAYPSAGASNPIVDALVDAEFSDDVIRVMRGATFVNSAASLRSASHDGDRPARRVTYSGFRPARTYP
jgi:formylglycine-generating enzyme required for sulfatase activity/tRNA A-37 threonylcarbamoyl transferase component Bud32